MKPCIGVLAAACLLALPVTAGDDVTIEGHAFRPERRDVGDDDVARFRVPDGFRVEVLARGLGEPRMMAVDDDGTVYVTRPRSGDVIALSPGAGGGRAAPRTVVAGLDGVHGITRRDRTLYLAMPTRVVSVELPGGPDARPRTVVDGLPGGGQHPNRTLAFGPDGALYVSVGSTCNACQEPDPESATLLRVSADGTRRVYARGLRNTIGFGWHPRSGVLYGMDHGTDWLGDDRPPEELNRIEDGKDYGWPYCFGDRQVDPQMKPPEGTHAAAAETKESRCARTTGPVQEAPAHGAPIGLVFYDAAQFPERYRGAAFVAMHGSWNRKPASGYEVVAIPFDAEGPTAFEPFLSGFLVDGGAAYLARPAGLAVARDGALLLTDDGNGVLYRVSHAPRTAAEAHAR